MTDATLGRVMEMRSQHIDGCAAIVEQTELFQRYGYVGELARAQLERAMVDPRAHLLVYGEGDAAPVCGFAWYVERGAFDHSGYLRLIAVAPQARGHGIGTALMQHIENMLVGRGGMVLLVSRGNADGQRFYERLGYRKVGEIDSYVGEGLDELIYFKPAER